MAQVVDDPVKAAYFDALGFQKEVAQTGAADAITRANRQTEYQLPEVQFQGTLARENVDSDALGRGTWSSGEHELALARQRHAEQYQTGAMLLNQADTVGQIQTQLAQQLADLQLRGVV